MKFTQCIIFLEHDFNKKEEIKNKKSRKDIDWRSLPNVRPYLIRTLEKLMNSKPLYNIVENKFSGEMLLNGEKYYLECFLKEIKNTRYLDICIEGRKKEPTIKCLELVQEELLNSGIHDQYVDIISYDAVSEFYCNKIYNELNKLERNLRKLLYNITIFNYGFEFYEATASEELQSEIKERIGKSFNHKNKKREIKMQYNVSEAKANEIYRFQQFFYAMDYSNIEKYLFTQIWTEYNEEEKKIFLKKNKDLSKMSNDEIRAIITKFTPQSNWDRFFKKKILIKNIEEMISKVRKYRNEIAHFKFFKFEDYKDCKKMLKSSIQQ